MIERETSDSSLYPPPVDVMTARAANPFTRASEPPVDNFFAPLRDKTMGGCVARCLPALVHENYRLKKEVAALRLRLDSERAYRTDWDLVQQADGRVARTYECKICFEQPIQCVLLPCGHAMSCHTCAYKMGSVCGVCKSEVETVTSLTLV